MASALLHLQAQWSPAQMAQLQGGYTNYQDRRAKYEWAGSCCYTDPQCTLPPPPVIVQHTFRALLNVLKVPITAQDTRPTPHPHLSRRDVALFIGCALPFPEQPKPSRCLLTPPGCTSHFVNKLVSRVCLGFLVWRTPSNYQGGMALRIAVGAFFDCVSTSHQSRWDALYHDFVFPRRLGTKCLYRILFTGTFQEVHRGLQQHQT